MEKVDKVIDFPPELFNNLYWHLKEAIEDENIRYIWCYGGSSAAKTFSVCQLTLRNMLDSGNYNSMVMRKVSEDIKDSIYSDFKKIIDMWGMGHLFVCQQNFIKCVTGSYIRFRGLDDSEKVKGISNFKKIILEEISQFEEEDFSQLKLRLRGQKGQQLICLFNPIRQDHWIKEKVFDIDEWLHVDQSGNLIQQIQINKSGNSVILKTNYLDNKWIVGPDNVDKHVLDLFEHMRVHDYSRYEVYALANWGRLVTGGEFYSRFKPEIHIKRDIAYNAELPLHISFDFNVQPYMTLTVWQLNGKKAFEIYEICPAHPNNNTIAACKLFLNKYFHELGHGAGLFVYGDPAGRHEDTRSESGHNDFTLIKSTLDVMHPTMRVISKAPPVKMRGDFINAILGSNYEDLSISFDYRCVNTINDLSYGKQDKDGAKLKEKAKNKDTGISCEKFHHCSDAMDYFLCNVFEAEFVKFQRGGKPMGKIMYKPKNRVY